ncbi:hypothetical protein [Deinococcus alpinitundrae]|uniref:hypothetical protein n=1 Tax=Deinococcus alpinitundrae TaxID=468913 RepID=UPI001379B156|nr:hypothetical protein [Deinococcus alpinitundrae]
MYSTPFDPPSSPHRSWVRVLCFSAGALGNGLALSLLPVLSLPLTFLVSIILSTRRDLEGGVVTTLFLCGAGLAWGTTLMIFHQPSMPLEQLLGVLALLIPAVVWMLLVLSVGAAALLNRIVR